MESPLLFVTKFRTRGNIIASAQNPYTVKILRFKNKCLKMSMIVLYALDVLWLLH
jgi:hypothetical protein